MLALSKVFTPFSAAGFYLVNDLLLERKKNNVQGPE